MSQANFFTREVIDGQLKTIALWLTHCQKRVNHKTHLVYRKLKGTKLTVLLPVNLNLPAKYARILLVTPKGELWFAKSLRSQLRPVTEPNLVYGWLKAWLAAISSQSDEYVWKVADYELERIGRFI